MSKAEKKIVDFEKSSVLQELGLPDLLKDYKRFLKKEQEYKDRKSTVSQEIGELIKEVRADGVAYEEPNRGTWTAYRIQPDDKLELNEDKLRDNMMKIGKLDAVTVAKIFEASIDRKPQNPQVRVYPPKEDKK